MPTASSCSCFACSRDLRALATAASSLEIPRPGGLLLSACRFALPFLLLISRGCLSGGFVVGPGWRTPRSLSGARCIYRPNRRAAEVRFPDDPSSLRPLRDRRSALRSLGGTGCYRLPTLPEPPSSMGGYRQIEEANRGLIDFQFSRHRNLVVMFIGQAVDGRRYLPSVDLAMRDLALASGDPFALSPAAIRPAFLLWSLARLSPAAPTICAGRRLTRVRSPGSSTRSRPTPRGFRRLSSHPRR